MSDNWHLTACGRVVYNAKKLKEKEGCMVARMTRISTHAARFAVMLLAGMCAAAYGVKVHDTVNHNDSRWMSTGCKYEKCAHCYNNSFF